MANSKIGGWSKPPPLKSVKGFVWADQRRCDWSDKNDVIEPGIYSGVKRFFFGKKRMETDKYITVVSGTHDTNNIRLFTNLSFGEDWEVALVQAYIPHNDSHFRDNFKKYFPNNKIIGGLAVHYNTSPTATTSVSKTTTIRVDDIIDGVGNGTSKLDVLKMIYSVAWNKIMYELRTDSSVTAAYPKDSIGDMLHQTLEETTHGVTLKGYALKGGRFTLDKTLAQMMGVLNVAGTGLGSGVHYRIRDNDNIKKKPIRLQ